MDAALFSDPEQFQVGASDAVWAEWQPKAITRIEWFEAEELRNCLAARDAGKGFHLKRTYLVSTIVTCLALAGCQKDQPKAPQGGGAGIQAMPVKTVAVSLQPVAQSSEYMATVKSRRSATILPQVSGMLTSILVHSGEHVKAGQVLMTIDPRQQQANLASQ